MSYRELTMIDVKEMLRRWSAGQGDRKIARETGTDRKTVRRYTTVAEQLALPRDRELTEAEVHEVAQRVQARPVRDASAEWEAVAKHKVKIAEWLSRKRPLRLTKVHTLLGRERGRSELRHATSLRDTGARLAQEGADDPARGSAGRSGGAGRLRQDGDDPRRRDRSGACALGAGHHAFVQSLPVRVADVRADDGGGLRGTGPRMVVFRGDDQNDRPRQHEGNRQGS